jgi:hypothetical protein
MSADCRIRGNGHDQDPQIYCKDSDERMADVPFISDNLLETVYHASVVILTRHRNFALNLSVAQKATPCQITFVSTIDILAAS